MEERRTGAGFWTRCPEALAYKNARTAQGYTDVPGRQDITIFAVAARASRQRGNIGRDGNTSLTAAVFFKWKELITAF